MVPLDETRQPPGGGTGLHTTPLPRAKGRRTVSGFVGLAAAKAIAPPLFAMLVAIGALCGCDNSATPASAPAKAAPLAAELILLNYAEDLPQEILDGFTREFGVRIDYQSFESQEEAATNLRAGKVYDVVVLENRLISALVAEKLLAELNHANLPNLKHISANFRDLAHDPGNRFSVPFNWGTTGLVVRSDLVAQPVTRWADLWDPRHAGKVGLWMEQRRDVLGLALKSLGFSANSENPSELEAALQRLLALKPHTLALEKYDPDNSSEVMSSGKVVVALGYAKDVLEGRKKNPAITYVLPAEGVMLWGDNHTIPAASTRKRTAETLINYLLRPEVAARIANTNSYATANETALPLIEPAIRNDQVVFPSNESMARAELQIPLTPEGEALHAATWERFVNHQAQGE